MSTPPALSPEGRPYAVAAAAAEVSPSRGSPEGHYVAGPGKSVFRQVTSLQEQRVMAAAKVGECQRALKRAEDTDQERKQDHRGGDRSWLLRLLIPVAVTAEAVTAYVAMEALVTSRSLATGLSVLAALVGAGMACIFANRRLNRLSVPAAARILEGIFVAVLTGLRYDSLHILGAGVLAAAGGAALAALISALGLLGIEEIVFETRTFLMFVSTLRVTWSRWRYALAKSRLARIEARAQAAVRQFQQHFLDFLLKIEELPLDQAHRRASAFKAAVADPEA